MDPKIFAYPLIKRRKKNRGDAKALFYPYIFLYCITVKGVYVLMNSLLKRRSFAGNSPRFSFLTFLFMVLREKRKNKALSGVCQGVIFLQFMFIVY